MTSSAVRHRIPRTWSGVILRLNDNGTTPADNPFLTGFRGFGTCSLTGSEHVRDRVRPRVGSAVDQQIADDAFDEMNSWNADERGLGPDHGAGGAHPAVQTDRDDAALGRAACSEQRSSRSAGRRPTSPTARKRRLRLHRPAGIALQRSGVQLALRDAPSGDRLPPAALSARSIRTIYRPAGAATPLTMGGYLFRFNLTGNRRKIAVDDPRLDDRHGQQREARHHGEREPALRHGLASERTSRPARTEPVRGFPDAGRGLRDLPSLMLGAFPEGRSWPPLRGLQLGYTYGAIRFRRGRFSGRAASVPGRPRKTTGDQQQVRMTIAHSLSLPNQ